jgi:hypothetical protein
MRGPLVCAIGAAAVGGCSLFVSLDGLHDDAPAVDSGTIDAASDASTADVGADVQTGSTYAQTVLADSPIAYYRLGDTGSTAVDSTSHHLDGTYTDVVTHAAGLIAGDSDQAALFSGALDGGAFPRLYVPRNALLEPSAAVSVEAWIRPLTVDAEIVSYGPQTGSPFQPYVIQLNNPSPNGATFFLATVGFFTGTTSIAAGSTYHFVGTYNGSTVVIYLNGVQIYSNGATGMLSDYDGVTGLAIGSGALGEAPFTGEIDEVAIYDHALTVDRVAAHYLAGTK